MYASLMLFFISNAIETQLITSGAFEIYLNGKLGMIYPHFSKSIIMIVCRLTLIDVQIWSKLQSERVPHEKELFQMLDMNFNFDADKANVFKV
jgi:hypothetical protein